MYLAFQYILENVTHLKVSEYIQFGTIQFPLHIQSCAMQLDTG